MEGRKEGEDEELKEDWEGRRKEKGAGRGGVGTRSGGEYWDGRERKVWENEELN